MTTNKWRLTDLVGSTNEDINTNVNGIPVECEGAGMMGGGEGTAKSSSTGSGESTAESSGTPATGSEDTGETPVPPEDEEAAWEAFYEWASVQCWGPDCEATTTEQFQALVDKLRELGLPLEAMR